MLFAYYFDSCPPYFIYKWTTKVEKAPVFYEGTSKLCLEVAHTIVFSWGATSHHVIALETVVSSIAYGGIVGHDGRI